MSGPSAGRRRPASARSNSSNAARTSGKTTASSRSMPGDCAPWPGKRNATGCAGPRRLGLEEDAPGIVEAGACPRRSPSAPASACRAGRRARRPRSPGSRRDWLSRLCGTHSPRLGSSVCDRSREQRSRAGIERLGQLIDLLRPAGRARRPARPSIPPASRSASTRAARRRCGRTPRGRRGSSCRRTRRR